MVGLGQGTTQEGEGDAGSTLSKVSTEDAHRNNNTRRRRSGIRRARVHDNERPPSVLVLRMGREHRAVREREAVWEDESDGSCSPASFASWPGSELRRET
jgi:hypothetical protein